MVLAHGSGHGLGHAPVPLTTLPGPGAAPPAGDAPTADDAPPADVGPAVPGDVDLFCGAYRLTRRRVPAALRRLPDVTVVTTSGGAHPELAATVELLRSDVAERPSGAEVVRSALLDLLLVQALRAWQQQGTGCALEVAEPGIAAALARIHESPGAPWSVQQLGEVAGLSRTAFTRRFAALVGAPPMAYVTARRLALAARQLRETRRPLAAIAADVGYGSEYSFAAAFRRELGVAPGRYRRRSAEGHAADQLAGAARG